MRRTALLGLLALSACGGGAKAAVTTSVDSSVSHTPVSSTLPQTTTTVDDGVPDEVQAAEVAIGQPRLTAKRYAEMKGECDAIAAEEPAAMQRVTQALPWQLGNVVWNLMPVCKDTVSDMLDGLENATTTTTLAPVTTTEPPTTTTTVPPTLPPPDTIVITYDGPDEAGARAWIETFVAGIQPDLAGLCPLLHSQPDMVRSVMTESFDDPGLYEVAANYGYTHPLKQKEFLDMTVIAYSNRLVRECG